MEVEFGNIILEIPEHIVDIVNYLKYIVIAVIIYFLCTTCVIPIVKVVISKIIKFKRKRELRFNEFDDFERIKQQEVEREQLENEWEYIEDACNEMNPNNPKKVRKIMKSIKILDTLDVEDDEFVDGGKIKRILEEDNTFNADLFKKWSSNIFEYILISDIQELKHIKNSMTEKLFDKKTLQLRQFERDNLELKREDLLVEDVKIMDYVYGNGRTELKVYIKASLREYIMHKQTKRILRGSKRKFCKKGYILTFHKFDSEEKEGFIENCDTCGAIISETEFCRCKYCGALVNPIRYNWTLINFETV